MVFLFSRCKGHQNDDLTRLVEDNVLAVSDTASYRELINLAHPRGTNSAMLNVLYQIEFNKIWGTYYREWIPGSYTFDKTTIPEAAQKAENGKLEEYLLQLAKCGLISRETLMAEKDSIRHDKFYAKFELLKELSNQPGY